MPKKEPDYLNDQENLEKRKEGKMSDTLERSPVVVVEDLDGDRVSGPKSNVCHPHTESLKKRSLV